MQFYAVERRGAAHDAPGLGQFASASAVRAHLAGGDWRQAVPETSAMLLSAWLCAHNAPVRLDALDQALLYRLRTGGDLPDDSQHLRLRMRKAAEAATTASHFLELAKSRAFTMARIKRALMLGLLQVHTDELPALRAATPYVRLLGYSRRVPKLPAVLAAAAGDAFFTSPARYTSADPYQARLLALDILAGDLYTLAYQNPAERELGREYTQRLVVD